MSKKYEGYLSSAYLYKIWQRQYPFFAFTRVLWKGKRLDCLLFRLVVGFASRSTAFSWHISPIVMISKTKQKFKKLALADAYK